jgi:hypothetical protein
MYQNVPCFERNGIFIIFLRETHGRELIQMRPMALPPKGFEVQFGRTLKLIIDHFEICPDDDPSPDAASVQRTRGKPLLVHQHIPGSSRAAGSQEGVSRNRLPKESLDLLRSRPAAE